MKWVHQLLTLLVMVLVGSTFAAEPIELEMLIDHRVHHARTSHSEKKQ